jgi:hypothetical protein
MSTNETWITEWTSGKLPVDEDSKNWIVSRPASIKKLMLRFPPSCVVKARVPLLIPAPGQVGIVTSYFEPMEKYPEGLVTVRTQPASDTVAQCDPAQLEVVAFYKGLDSAELSKILEE